MMSCLGYVVAALAVMVLGCLLNGYTVSVLWEWFMVPTFALPSLSVPTAMGVSLVISYLTRDVDPDRDKDREPLEALFYACGAIVVRAVFALGIGWIIHQFA